MSFPPRKLQAIEMLALGTCTYTEIAAECNITQKTLRRWRADKAFAEAVLDRSRAIMKEKLPSIYNVLADNAVTGSHQHIKLVLDHIAKLEELKQTAEQESFTFTWRQSPATNEEVWETDGTQ